MHGERWGQREALGDAWGVVCVNREFPEHLSGGFCCFVLDRLSAVRSGIYFNFWLAGAAAFWMKARLNTPQLPRAAVLATLCQNSVIGTEPGREASF